MEPTSTLLESFCFLGYQRLISPYFTAVFNVARHRGGEAAQTILDVRGTALRFVIVAPADPQGSPLACQSAGALG